MKTSTFKIILQGIYQHHLLKSLAISYSSHILTHSSTMDNCCAGNFFKKKQSLPIDTTFKLPVPVSNSSWPPGIHYVIH